MRLSPVHVEALKRLAARLAAQAGMARDGRKVDVLLGAPNLKRLPIHEVAEQRGVLL